MISVFGSTGFIGSHFCGFYPDEVIEIPRESREPQSNNILYLISTTHNYNVFTDPHLDINTNLNILVDVLEHTNKDTVFNFVSSWFVYGDTDLPAKETSVCNPKGFYSITKKCAEDLLISYCNTFGLSYRIFRLANVYGVGDKYSRQKNALQWLISQLADGEDIKLYYDGNFVRDYIHVYDVVRAMKHIMQYEYTLNQVYNIGSGIGYIFSDLIYYAEKRLKETGVIVGSVKETYPSDFHKVVQVKDMYLDTSKLSSLGFVPQVDIETGLDTFIVHLMDKKNGK